MADAPHRVWLSCSFGTDGGLVVNGLGRVEVGSRLTISANGRDIEVVAVEWSMPPGRWVAVDVASYDRTHRPASVPHEGAP